MIIRFVFASFLVATGFYLILGQTTRHIAVRRLLFGLFIVSGISSLIFQNLWTRLSNELGVETGTALLTYLIAISFISYVITSYKWRRQQEDQIVHLARHFALKEFEKDNLL